MMKRGGFFFEISPAIKPPMQNMLMQMVNVKDIPERLQPNSLSIGTAKMDHAYISPRKSSAAVPTTIYTDLLDSFAVLFFSILPASSLDIETQSLLYQHITDKDTNIFVKSRLIFNINGTRALCFYAECVFLNFQLYYREYRAPLIYNKRVQQNHIKIERWRSELCLKRHVPIGIATFL